MNVIRADINNGLFVMTLCVSLLLIVHLALSMRQLGYRATYDRLGNRAAVAVLIYMGGETILRGLGGVALRMIAHGEDPLAVEILYHVALGAWVVCIVGAACMMRIFSRKEWGHKVWIGSVLLSVAVVAVLRLV